MAIVIKTGTTHFRHNKKLLKTRKQITIMKKLLSLLIVAFFSTAIFAQTKWNADLNHSKLTFSVTHMGISDVDGLFNKFKASAIANKADFSDAVFELSVEVPSINTQVEMRDNHLRSADFFEVEKYPSMTFKSTSITKVSKDKYKLNGNLTLRGITKPVTMDLWYRGTNVDAKTNKSTAGFQLTGIIKRSDFNVGPKFTAPMLSDEVKIKADGEFISEG
jgi:polyisoprenoid-binding protein YceI